MNEWSNRKLSRSILIGVFLTLVLLVSLASQSATTRGAPDTTGDLLQTVNLPEAAICSSGLGTSVALVPGSTMNLAQYPILLVTSCYSSTGVQVSDLYFH